MFGWNREQPGPRPLLEDLVERGVKPDRQRLFVIDGSKACGTDFPVGLLGQPIALTGWKAGPTCVAGCPAGDLALYC